MAAYAALLSLVQTIDLNRRQGEDLSSIVSTTKINDFLEYANLLLSFLEENPAKASRWEGRIRKAANDVEDIIEGFTLQLRQSSHVRMNPSSLEQEGQVEGAKEEMGLILGEMMDDERPGYLPAAAAPSPSTPANDAVIGLHDDLMAIKERVCGESSSLKVIPIVGMGGIGKTTLARTIYDDQLILEYFQIRVWLTVSQDYSPLKFRKTLLDSMKLLEEQMSGHDVTDETEMEIKAFRALKSRKYLIVMDDVWDTEFWDDVRNIFPDDNNGSRIMLTTRESAVAAYPDPCSSLHKMQLLNNDQSWDLLKHKVFKNSICPRNLEGVGAEIARKCAGLPLAVVLVAGFLSAVDETAASWKEIAENVNPVVGREVDEILSLSYAHLPHRLRPCFLFFGGFPEDENILASKLVKLWVAEDFMRQRCDKSLEEEAEEYLEDLVKRNLVLVSSRKSNGKIKKCNLHDMVRDLCIRKAHEEKFLHVIDGNVCFISDRRINFNRDDIDQIWSPTIRTILCFKEQRINSWLAFLGQFRLLRVLDVVHHKFIHELPSQLFELFYLRYLALRHIYLGERNIPTAISNLVNLQTLIIYAPWHGWKRRQRAGENRFDFYLPWEIWRMPHLRHIVCNDLYFLPHPSHGLILPDPLQNLQTLSPVTDFVWSDVVVQMIPNLKKLGLVYTMKQEYGFRYLQYLGQLQELQLFGYEGVSWVGQNLTFPKALKKLILVGGGLPWNHLTTIVGSLPNLEVLKLRQGACVGETWETREEGFPELKLLLIDDSDLQHWITRSSHFPKLKRLLIHRCMKLREIPEGIGEIPTLELIELLWIFAMKMSLLESAMQIKEDQESCGNYDLQVRLRP